MENTYEKVIKLIEKEFKGNYKHEIEGKKYIIEMLKEEEHLCRNKYIGYTECIDNEEYFDLEWE